jgi:hypothetical protein
MSEQSRDWRELCRAIIAEQDTSRLLELVSELNRVLEEKNLPRHYQLMTRRMKTRLFR